MLVKCHIFPGTGHPWRLTDSYDKASFIVLQVCPIQPYCIACFVILIFQSAQSVLIVLQVCPICPRYTCRFLLVHPSYTFSVPSFHGAPQGCLSVPTGLYQYVPKSFIVPLNIPWCTPKMSTSSCRFDLVCLSYGTPFIPFIPWCTQRMSTFFFRFFIRMSQLHHLLSPYSMVHPNDVLEFLQVCIPICPNYTLHCPFIPWCNPKDVRIFLQVCQSTFQLYLSFPLFHGAPQGHPCLPADLT